MRGSLFIHICGCVCVLVCVYCQSIWQMPEPRKFLNAQRGPSSIDVVAIAAAAVV